MSTWKVILATIVIFAAGAVTGGLLVRKTSTTPTLLPPNIWRSAMLRKMTDELNLTPEQRLKVNAVLEESHERTKLLWEFVGPYFQDEYRELNEDLRAALTPDQRKKFEALLKDRQKRFSDKPGGELSRPSLRGGNPPPKGSPPGRGRPEGGLRRPPPRPDSQPQTNTDAPLQPAASGAGTTQ